MLTRRHILSTGSSVLGAAAFGTFPFDQATAQAAAPRRRRIHELALDDPIVQTYRDGVRILRDNNGGSEINWDTITTIHGTANGFNRCPHGNWYFLPWHRGYLVMLERIIRDVTQTPDFALPYWDWTLDPGLPPHFTDPTYNGQTNPLYEEKRYMAPTDTIPEEFTGSQVMQTIFDETDFELFGTSRGTGQNNTDARWIQTRGASGPLERTAHDNVHGVVGGANANGEGGLMASSLSALDPIFWLHHCNIDRIWSVWNQNGGVNTTDPLWLNMQFRNHFVRSNGTSFSWTVRDLQQILPLGYRYGLPPPDQQRPDTFGTAQIALNTNTVVRTRSLPGSAPAPSAVPRFRSLNQEAAAPGKPLEISVAATGGSLSAALRAPPVAARSVRSARSIGSVAAPPARQKRVLAIIRDIKQPANGSTAVRVFINGENVSEATPTTSPNYVGTYGFFGGEHVGHAGHADSSIIVDLTKTLRRLEASGKPVGDNIKVQLVPISSAKGGKASPVIPASVEIVVV